MNLDSFSFSLIKFKHGTNRSYLFLVSLIKLYVWNKGITSPFIHVEKV